MKPILITVRELERQFKTPTGTKIFNGIDDRSKGIGKPAELLGIYLNDEEEDKIVIKTKYGLTVMNKGLAYVSIEVKTVEKMKRYYTEYPMDEFDAESDEEALDRTKAQFVYTESDTENGLPFIILRNTRPPHRPD